MNAVQSILYSLSYQVVRPSVTTMGACSKGCGLSARGGAVCAVCLIEALPEGMRRPARLWMESHQRNQVRWTELERMAEKTHEM